MGAHSPTRDVRLAQSRPEAGPSLQPAKDGQTEDRHTVNKTKRGDGSPTPANGPGGNKRGTGEAAERKRRRSHASRRSVWLVFCSWSR